MLNVVLYRQRLESDEQGKSVHNNESNGAIPQPATTSPLRSGYGLYRTSMLAIAYTLRCLGWI